MRVDLTPRKLLSGALSLALASGPGWAKAASGEATGLGVLPTTHDNKLDGAARDELATRLRTGLERGEVPLVASEAATPECDATCRTTFSEAGASHLVRASVEQANRDYNVKLELVDTNSGEVVAEVETTCEICGLDELGELVEGQGAVLQTKLAALDVPASILTVTSTPPGAVVIVDGEGVGKTPLEREMMPGEHRIRVVRTGYVTEDRRVTVVDGVSQAVDVSLKKSPANSRNVIIGAVGTGVGAALLGAGIGLLAVNGRPQPGCADEDLDADGDCKYIFKTVPIGASFAIPGAVLATVGVMLLIQNRELLGNRKRRKQARLQPGISPFGVSLRGRF